VNFYDNFVRRCISVGKSPSAVALEIGLAKPTVNRWKNGGGVTDATARKVADYFGISVAELTGGDDDKTKKPADQKADGLRGTGYEKLTPENRAMIDALIDSLLRSQSDE
jgi:transcriptional regulator with XRE-family HTH domain